MNNTMVILKEWIICAFLLANILLGCSNKPTMELAAGKYCKAFSSIESNEWSLNRLTDGEKGGKGWSSKAFSLYADRSLYPEYVVIDLGSCYDIDKISLFPRGDREMAGKGFPEDFTIQVSLEGEPWKVVIQKQGYPKPVNGTAQTFSLKKNTIGRYVKIEATRLSIAGSGRYYFQLSEIEIFGRKLDNIPLKIAKSPANKVVNAVNNLRCENEENPVGIDVQNPRFSWCIESPERDITQKAYQILVASNEALLKKEEGDMWNSGRVESENSISVSYEGKPLQSGKQYWWKVKVFSKKGKKFDWSNTTTFVTGKINQSDWKGKWIGANADNRHEAVYLRKEINVSKPVKSAMVYFCGLGYSELTIDGQKVGDYVMGPGFSTYNKRTKYLAFDVTEQFSALGLKALGVTLVDGWYALEKDPWFHGFEKNTYVDKPKLLLDLHIEYKDGTESVIISDDSWKWSDGPITFSWIAQEHVDLRKVQTGWDKPGFNDSKWNNVKVVNGPAGVLVNERAPLCQVIDEIHPKSMTYDSITKIYRFDLGREVAGVVRFRTKGERGTAINITPLPSDKDYMRYIKHSPRTSKFVLVGKTGYEVYEPRFFHIAIKYIEIKGLTQTPELEDVTVLIQSSGWERAGNFDCSDGIINFLEKTARRTSEYYTTTLPNDPTREWKIWTNDAQTGFLTNKYLFNAQRMYERWQLDMVNDQREDGNVPNISPGPYFDWYNSPWWGGMVVWLPWNLYQYYGNESILKESYPAMKQYVDYLSSVSKNGLQDFTAEWGLADWCPIEETPRPIINTPAYYFYSEIVSKTADLMGETEDAIKYSELAAKIKKVFNEQFLDIETGIYGQLGWNVTPGHPSSVLNGLVPHEIWWSGDRVCTQAGQALPLALGLVPEKLVSLVEKALLSEIQAHGHHVSTGFVSTPYLLQVLLDLAPEAGWKMTTSQDYPSWYSNTAGSDNDLMKEMWHGGHVFMPSLAGNIVIWIYQSLGGIRPESPGFKKIRIKPNIIGDLHWVNSSYNSVYGEIVSNWQKREKQIAMDITIPCNTTAIVYIPAKNITDITESGNPIDKVEDVKFLYMENNAAVFAVVSGTYRFQSILP